LVDRDPDFDGRFVYAVSTTGVYCRPSCPSRRALRKNVSFFAGPEAAEAAGFRACKRCRPDQRALDGRPGAVPRDVLSSRVAEWCAWIRDRVARGETVTLEGLGRRAGRSAGYVQRTFRAVIGMSPRRYAEGLRLELFKGALRTAGSVTEAIYEAGFGSSSRAYQGGDARLGMTPRAYRRGGDGTQVSFTVLDLPELEGIGLLLVAATDRGLCSVSLGSSPTELEARLRRELPRAAIHAVHPPYSRPLGGWIAALRDHLRGQTCRRALPLDLRATALRLEVWRYLRSIPTGEVRTYSEVAAAVGRSRAVRAVASACAANPVALLIPCHRVLRADGGLGGYRWGLSRKRKLLAAEQQQASESRRASPR
jgi:AraC family transcriptional regulator of adaptative response/methylated-DNA-[protein]-cysteine methyltransferase